MNQTDPTVYPVRVHCKQALDINTNWIYGQCGGSHSFCLVLIQVPSSTTVRTHIEYLEPAAENSSLPWNLQRCTKPQVDHLKCDLLPRSMIPGYYLSTDQFYLLYNNRPPLQIRFEVLKGRLNITFTSDYTGLVTLRNVDGMGTVCDQLNAPIGHAIMVSLERIPPKQCGVSVLLSCVESGNTHRTVDSFSGGQGSVVRLYNAAQLNVCVIMSSDYIVRKSCFKLLFSFLYKDIASTRLRSGLTIRSAADFLVFQTHLLCNLKEGCEEGRAETGHCFITSLGWMAVGQKCFKRFYSKMLFKPVKAHVYCRSLGFELALIKTRQEFQGLKNYLLSGIELNKGQLHAEYNRKRSPKLDNLIGLTLRLSVASYMYRHFLIWADKTIIYNMNHMTLSSQMGLKKGYYFQLPITRPKLKFPVRLCGRSCTRHFVCEKPALSQKLFSSPSVKYTFDQQSLPAFRQSDRAMVLCPEGHVTHLFFSCDPESRFENDPEYLKEGSSASKPFAYTLVLYSCFSGDAEVSYSLLCDLRHDCADNSDEAFCYYPVCTDFSCPDGQCLSLNQLCNIYADCLDGSDEEMCQHKQRYWYPSYTKYQDQNMSYLINLDGGGFFTQQVMNLTDPCPGTHYRCTKEWFYCLPVYTRCNGVFDCIFQEDERDCERWTCPGLYRCRDSTVCVHADHMCDGWSQCPQRDDEWLCDIKCPAQCLCQGHAFLCLQLFSAHLFPQLRYLDARATGLTPSHLRNNAYLVHLNLAHCSITFLPKMEFFNLQFLDLSYNEITSVLVNIFAELPNLQSLIFKGNPLTSLIPNPINVRQKMLRRIDLSESSLAVFDSRMLSYISGLRFLNISYSKIHSIKTQFVQSIPLLRELDMRGTILNSFPSDLLSGLNDLVRVFASDYRLCCDKVLPNIAPKPRCLATQHYLSSCDDMLQSEVYRLNFWFVAVLASLANLFCFTCHCVEICVTIPYGGPVVVFMASLQCADFCMGIYASVIAIAHEMFSGQYLHHEDMWKESVACKVAGFFSLLSNEASILSIFFLTLDHLIILKFPLNTYRFSRRSAAAACGVTWFVGILLASIPLLPKHFHLGHYGQTAVCSPMLHTRPHVSHQHCFLHTILCFNMLICVVVCAMLVIIHRAVPRHRLQLESGKTPGFTSVDVMMRIAVTTVAGWFSMTTASLLTFAGLEINVFMVIMVLPLNSTVNPLLCLWHVVAYKRRQKQEERLLNLLKLRTKCLSNSAPVLRQRNNRR